MRQTHSVKLDFLPQSHDQVSIGYYKLPGIGTLVHIFEVSRDHGRTKIRYTDLDGTEHEDVIGSSVSGYLKAILP